MCLPKWVEVGSCRDTSVGVISKLVDMESMLTCSQGIVLYVDLELYMRLINHNLIQIVLSMIYIERHQGHIGVKFLGIL